MELGICYFCRKGVSENYQYGEPTSIEIRDRGKRFIAHRSCAKEKLPKAEAKGGHVTFGIENGLPIAKLEFDV